MDINAPFEAHLSATDFNNATKLNRPKLLVGSVVMCRVSWTGSLDRPEDQVAQPASIGNLKKLNISALPPTYYFTSLELNDCCEVSCQDPNDPRNWSSLEVYLGELDRNAGFFFEVPIGYAMR